MNRLCALHGLPQVSDTTLSNKRTPIIKAILHQRKRMQSWKEEKKIKEEGGSVKLRVIHSLTLPMDGDAPSAEGAGARLLRLSIGIGSRPAAVCGVGALCVGVLEASGEGAVTDTVGRENDGWKELLLEAAARGDDTETAGDFPAKLPDSVIRLSLGDAGVCAGTALACTVVRVLAVAEGLREVAVEEGKSPGRNEISESSRLSSGISSGNTSLTRCDFRRCSCHH